MGAVSFRDSMSTALSRPSALVIGAGVSGLTTARCLQGAGFDVTIIADRFQRGTTSVVAGALWEWPPAVCGFYEMAPEDALRDEQRWSVESYNRFQALAAQEGTGVYLRPVVFYSETPISENPLELRKIRELQPHVNAFAHDAGLISRPRIDPQSAFVDAYTYQTPLIDTDVYMAWLKGEVLSHGATVAYQRVEGSLATSLSELQHRHGADVVLNCTGLGARELSNDEIIPVRGAWLLVANDGSLFPKVAAAHCSSLQSSATGGPFLFIVPRGRDRLILGGIAQPGYWATELGDDYREVTTAIFDKCAAFMPELRTANITDKAEVRVGLRPFRANGVRLECELNIPIIHNYGHGGSGVTLSWGAANEAVLLAQSWLENRHSQELRSSTKWQQSIPRSGLSA